jgi:hypothetical protein
MPNEFGLDSQNPHIRTRLPSYETRARVLEYLQELQAKGRDIDYVALTTGLILDRAIVDKNVLGIELKWQSASLPGNGTQQIPVVSLERVGLLVAAVVRNWAALRNSRLYASSALTTLAQVIEYLQAAMKTNMEVNYVAIEDLEREAERRLKGGWPDAGWALLERCVLFDMSLGATRPFLASSDGKRLGLGNERVEDIVSSAVRGWEHEEKGDCGCS